MQQVALNAWARAGTCLRIAWRLRARAKIVDGGLRRRAATALQGA